MNSYSLNQAYVFIIFLLNGILIGFLFDFFRIIRKCFKTSNLLTYIQDILFWILTGISIIYSIFKFNFGELRVFIFIGIILGFSIYILTISTYFMNINIKICNFFKKYITNFCKKIKKMYNFLKNKKDFMIKCRK